MTKTTVRIRGIAPILLHNGLLVDPLNTFTREIDSAQKALKKAKSQAAFEALAKLEWLGGLYTNNDFRFRRDGNEVSVETDAQVGIIGEMLERCIIKSAGRKEVSAFKAGLICAQFCPLVVDGKVMTVKRGFGDEKYRFTRPAKIGMSKIMRTRPRFDNWEVTAELEFNEELFSARDLSDALNRSGRAVGIGDWRPRFGRFEVL